MRVAAHGEPCTEGRRRVVVHGGEPRVGPGEGDCHEEGRDQEEGGSAMVRHCECCRFNRASSR